MKVWLIFRPGLEFVLAEQRGPIHNPTFVIHVSLNDQLFVGTGRYDVGSFWSRSVSRNFGNFAAATLELLRITSKFVETYFFYFFLRTCTRRVLSDHSAENEFFLEKQDAISIIVEVVVGATWYIEEIDLGSMQ